MGKNKTSGILLHITSLPSNYGIGDLGQEAYSFVDQLKDAFQSFWQILPLNYPDEIACPYAAYSAFGANIYLISPDKLLEEGLLETIPEYFKNQNYSESRMNFPRVKEYKREVLQEAFRQFCSLSNKSTLLKEFQNFEDKQNFWLEDFSFFLSLTDRLGNKWTNWHPGLKSKEQKTLDEYQEILSGDIKFHKFCQFIFHKQWDELKSYANEKGIQFIGDMPIYVSHHSMDVWSWQEGFNLKADGTLIWESGAPPDDFSETGQKWATPTYKWENHEEQNFSWWMERIDYNLQLFDILRIDHFLGFENLWHIPANDPDATNGHWVKTPGRKILELLRERHKDMPFIAEDLGVISDDVVKLRDDFSLPGMKILQFAFGSDETNEHLPDNFLENSIGYTGTHDNDTILSYLSDQEEESPVLENLRDFYKKDVSKIDEWDLIETLLKSRALISVFPVQDILGLGGNARFNLPGTVENNWVWRLEKKINSPEAWMKLKALTKEYNRTLS
ncbi:MAG: 4-alpha-glucanotransferase [Bacteriovoracaceae bacterium]